MPSNQDVLNETYFKKFQEVGNGKVDANADITPATATKITYDKKGLITNGATASTSDIPDSTDKRYVTETEKTKLSRTITGTDGQVAVADGDGQAGNPTISLTKGYVDIFFPHGLPKTTGAGNPNLATYLGNLRGYEYAVNDAHDFDPQEYYHQCEVGAPITWHLHWLSRTNVAAARTVKWELERSFVSPLGVETLVSPNATIEVTVPANTPANTMYLTDIVIDTIAGIGPAWMMSARIKRIASSGTEPATSPVIKALHGHVRIDTPSGSRTITAK